MTHRTLRRTLRRVTRHRRLRLARGVAWSSPRRRAYARDLRRLALFVRQLAQRAGASPPAWALLDWLCFGGAEGGREE